MILSHPKEGDIKEKSLFEHLKNVGELSKSAIHKLKLNLNLINKNDLNNLVYLIGVTHDFGKSTSFFQTHLKNKNYMGKETHHALIFHSYNLQ